MSQPPVRRSSLGMLLRRSKSGDLGKGGKKAQALREQELERQRQQAAISRNPPKLPDFYNAHDQLPLSNSIPSDLRTDAGSVYSDDHRGGGMYTTSRPSMEPAYSVVGAPPVPPIPSNAYDPYARTESMTHRGRYSYASSAISTINSPRRVRRRKDPTPFNILIIGTRGAGKTSFLEFLKTSLALPPKKRSRRGEIEEEAPRVAASGNFIPHYLETEIEGERVGLTLWDSEGLEKNVVDLQLREMSAFLESRFEETFAEEMKVVRSPGVQDTHIHAAFMVLDPARLDRNLASAKVTSANGHGGKPLLNRVSGGLDEDLDLQVLRTLQGKTTVIPVVSKADTITTKHMQVLKKAVWDSLKKANLDPLEALGMGDDDDDSSDRIEEADEDALENDSDQSPEDDDLPIQGGDEAVRSVPSSPSAKRLSGQSIRRHKAKEEEKQEKDETPFLPLSIISPDLYEPEIAGRQFPWGFADPYDEQHCDFNKLKEAVFTEWRAELREASREQWYEGWRTSRLKSRDPANRRR
ncbi:hypothetical protein VD0002_g279 [Verticillium dahliae]|uniref:Sep4b n=2 Tax=Verticillium dahliae TaxID=27337 RepID=G2WY65_VERDV|nr:Sep4b [Verticillium dahliae VdLs.17]KAF3351026.1 Actin-related protein 2/3 complex subunit 4 [Verticillium dahliae VDG2]KAH6705510.1 hypothetical protein EV126DRAFT_168399 [Verticillium dahliae]EGY21023.1 Sep4b [Verticillium dahliae VdLs.17]PNH26884.1 hypothetical protein BJF96_g9826 [Verticillium dahliae]PNH55464.1 hypothetical protein VD0003_g2131 [Verticillium dahliae]